MKAWEEFIHSHHHLHKLKSDLTQKRYEHTVRVAQTALDLAYCHGGDKEKAIVASLLHDCAKNFSDNKKLRFCHRYGISLSEEEKLNPDLVHAKLGAHVAYHRFEVRDEEILKAISFHTTGRPGMSLLEKIVYVADAIEPGRKHQGRLDQARKTARIDIDEAICMILEDTVHYLEGKGRHIDPITLDAWNYYGLNLKKEKQDDRTRKRDAVNCLEGS